MAQPERGYSRQCWQMPAHLSLCCDQVSYECRCFSCCCCCFSVRPSRVRARNVIVSMCTSAPQLDFFYLPRRSKNCQFIFPYYTSDRQVTATALIFIELYHLSCPKLNLKSNLCAYTSTFLRGRLQFNCNICCHRRHRCDQLGALVLLYFWLIILRL